MTTAAAIKPTISKELLDRIDIRVGTIRSVSDLPSSKKLVRLIVDIGGREIRVLAALRGERENPAELEGRQALFAVNLEPRSMAGEVSEGMLFDIGYADGIRPVLAVPETPVPNGTRAG
jgi:methionine--tRNA ligase beta chain